MHLITDALPAGAARDSAARFLASSITAAHAAHPARWGLTQKAGWMRLNTGRPEAMTVTPDRIRMLVLLDALPSDVSAMAGVRVLANEDDPSAGFYASVPGSAVCVIDEPDRRESIDALERIQQAHLAFIARAVLSGLNGMTPRGHSPDAIGQLSLVVGRELPQPSYVTPEAA